MSIVDLNIKSLLRNNVESAARKKVVPTLYEEDTSKYAGPHKWQVQAWAKFVRRVWRYRTYTRWVEKACEHIDVKGLEHLESLTGPCVFVANHSSHLDTLVINESLPASVRQNLFYGAAQDRWFVKGKDKMVLQPWYQSLALGNFPIMRGGGAGALSYANWLLEKQQHVLLFPEGTRATGDTLGEFKHGATLLALRNQVPVVPVYLGGLQNLRPKGSKSAGRGQATIEFLPAIEFSYGSDVAAATDSIARRLNRAHLNFISKSRIETELAPAEGAASASRSTSFPEAA
ncbi:MAG: lysophospholipid acyltransferase family protein [Pseudomonadales bacterium]|jgi:1-acyl-sn-glycerol-3-phosphate acyltransferase|nr:lysophospholipid acyltransferase family protein [Pseudomonadales bacterium]